MVSDQEIKAANALINDATAPRVAVFVGGTSGIGLYTIKALVAAGTGVRVYIVGRKSSAERTQSFIQELNTVNPKAEIIWTEGETSLLAETKRVCESIKSKESRVDLLFLTAGYAPFGQREETTEGIEVAQSLEYYSRIAFIHHLLPLLSASEAPRVVSVLGGGLERENSIKLDDLDLKKPGNFSGINAQSQYVALNSVALDRLAIDNPNVTFIHSWPGWVATGNVNRGIDPNSLWGWFVWLFLKRLIGAIAISDEVSAQRYLFQSTSAYFGGRGVPWAGESGKNALGEHENAVFLVNYKGQCTPNMKVMPVLREKAQAKVWDHTQQILRPYL